MQDHTSYKQNIEDNTLNELPLIAYPTVISLSFDQLGFPNSGICVPTLNLYIFRGYKLLVEKIQTFSNLLPKKVLDTEIFKQLCLPTIHFLILIIILSVVEIIRLIILKGWLFPTLVIIVFLASISMLWYSRKNNFLHHLFSNSLSISAPLMLLILFQSTKLMPWIIVTIFIILFLNPSINLIRFYRQQNQNE